MLVKHLKPEQSVWIGETQIKNISNQSVRLLIDGPKEVKVTQNPDLAVEPDQGARSPEGKEV